MLDTSLEPEEKEDFKEWADMFYVGKVINIDGQEYKVLKIKKLRQELVLKLVA